MCPIYHFFKDVLEDLKKAIPDGDLESFNQRLSLVEEFFQDRESTVGGLATSGALCYAARVGSIPMMDTLIQKGAGKTLLQAEQQYRIYANTMVDNGRQKNIFKIHFRRIRFIELKCPISLQAQVCYQGSITALTYLRRYIYSVSVLEFEM